MAADLDFERQLHASMQPPPPGSLFETFADKARRHVDTVLHGNDTRWLLDASMRLVLTQLRNHQGRDRSVPLLEIVRATGLPPRTVKDIVRALRLQCRVLICSSRQGDGYWIAATHEEVVESMTPYRRQAISELLLCRAMLGESQSMDQFLSQLALDLEKEEDRRG